MKNQNGTDGHLSQDAAHKLRDLLENEEGARAFVRHFAQSAAAEMTKEDASPARQLLASIYCREYDQSVRNVFQLCESPIERLFFSSLLLGLLKSFVLARVEGPPRRDFRQVCSERREVDGQLFRCYCFYKSLPQDARPQSFRSFLEMTGVEPGELAAEDADQMDAFACVLFDLRFIHAIHITLQPKFENFDGHKGARADAVCWIPSDEKALMVIECDGFEHHGNRETFAQDRKRDRLFQRMGYQVRRYAGSEIHNQPIQSSFDLVEFFADHNWTKMRGDAWEQAHQKHPSARASDELIQSWRELMMDAKASNG